MTPEFARRILQDHPDLSGCAADDEAVLRVIDRHRPERSASLLDFLREIALRPTERESYWINKMVSECGEFGQVAGNVGCFGIDTPDKGGTARERMEEEAADIHAATVLAIRHGVLSGARIARRSLAKQKKLLDPTQRDNLGRPLAPPLPDEPTPRTRLDLPTGPNPVAADPAAASAGDETETIAVSGRVKAEIAHLTARGAIDIDTLLRRALKIEPVATIPQDGTVGFRDPQTGFVLPEGFPIQRLHKGVTHHAKATGGGFENAEGTWFENLNQLNRSLDVGRPENAWIEWSFVDEHGRLRKLNAARPFAKQRARQRGRPAAIIDR